MKKKSKRKSSPRPRPDLSPHQAVAELWARGETDFLLHAGQRKIEAAFEASTYPIFGAECSRQIGKTFWGVRKVDQILRKWSGSSGRIGTAFHEDLDAIIIPAFQRVLATCPRSIQPKYKTKGSKFVYPNGSEVRLVGLDRNPDKMRGGRLRIVLLEEAAFGDSDKLNYVHKSVLVPAFTHEPDAQAAYISTPPIQGNDHSFCTLVDEAALHGSYIKLTIFDNPMLTAQRIAEICQEAGGPDSVTWRREYLCERIVDTERALIPEWKPEYELEFEPAQDRLFIFWHKYEFMDMGVQVDKTVCLFAYYDFEKATLFVLDEVDLSGSVTTTEQIRMGIVKKEKEWAWGNRSDSKFPIYRRIADNSHPLLINDLARGENGLVFSPTNKEKLHEMIGKVRIWTNAGRIKVHKRCKQLLGCLRTGIWDKHRKEFERSEVYGHYDALAALVYGVRNIDEWTNPVPSYIKNPDGWPMKKETKLSPMGQGMKDVFSRLK